MKDELTLLTVTNAHLFQRLVNADQHGFIAGTITLSKSDEASKLVEGDEYMLHYSRGNLVIDASGGLSGKPEDYGQGNLDVLMRQSSWTGVETKGFMTCRLIPLTENDTHQDYLIYGAFKQPILERKDPIGDFYKLGSAGIEIVPSPISSRGNNLCTLMRAPIWELGTKPRRTHTIEPHPTLLFKELVKSSELKIDFFLGIKTAKEISDWVDKNNVVNKDLFSTRNLDAEFYSMLAHMRQNANLPERTHVTDIGDHIRRSKAMSVAIKAKHSNAFDI